MILIKVNGYEYTIPEENLLRFAQYEAMQRMTNVALTNTAEAISYLLSLDMEVEYV